MFYLLLIFFLSTADADETFSCQAKYDELNITHQETQSIEHFYYCFGFHHGKDRAWQMDYFRRVAQGRNAEVMGLAHLKSDLMMRLLNLSGFAEELWSKFETDKRALLVNYAKGVNEGFKIGKKAAEFSKLGFKPEVWRPEDTISVLLLQSFDQTRKTFMRDYEEEKLKSKWGAKSQALFDEDHMPWENNILKEGEYETRETVVKTTQIRHSNYKLWSEFPTVFGLESGSNNWVVSKKKSKTGKAILANDPHLDLRTPLFWYWVNYKYPQAHVVGGSVPGVPVVVSGTNGHVAWGLTNSYLNSADIVHIKDLSDDQVESFRPKVMVKLWFMKLPFFFKSFERLKTGHRILPLESDNDQKLVLRWNGFSLKPSDFYPMFDIFKVKNVTEMGKIISTVGIPSWNFVFADSQGDIGYGLVGKTYRSLEKTPLGISSISFDELKKEDLLESTDRPALLKPSREYVYSANNRHWPSNAKFYGGRGYSYSYRGFRIDELLKGSQDVESFKNIQCDRQVVDARFFLPKLQRILNLEEFKGWSMLAEDSSKALPLYRRLMDLVIEKWEINEYALYRMLDQLTPNQVEDLRNIYLQAKEEIAGRSWGELHRIKFPHMSKSDDFIFSPELAGVGDAHSVNPGTANWNSDKKIYEQSSGASMRMIIEMEKTPKIWLALPGLNRLYDQESSLSPWEEWRNCFYREVKF